MATEMIRCDACGSPVAEVRDGVIIILARHHGDRHVTVKSIHALANHNALPLDIVLKKE